MSITVLNKNFNYNEYGVEITSAATLDEIKKELKSLHSSGELLPFAYGDILIHLRNSQDKSKEQFVNNFLSEDKNRSQLHNYIRVAENFDNKERTKYLKNLTFTHLKESLELTKDKSKAVALLNTASSERLSVSQMRAIYRTSIADSQDEPKMSVSPVVELINLAGEFSRKLKAATLNNDESALLLKELKDVGIWIDNYVSRKGAV